MNRLKDKVMIVTGGSLGIGKAACLMAAREGATVAVTDLLDDSGKAVVQEIEKQGGRSRYWHLDVGDEKQVGQVFADVVKNFGRIDVLVNNAGISGINKPTHEISEAEWDLVMRVNVKGVFLCTKHAIPYMKKNRRGSIINLSSIYGIVSAPDVPPYHASKGAVRLMSKTDALLYAKDNIRVNSIHPGFIWTPMVENHLKSVGNVDTLKTQVGNLHPLGHMGEVDDIAYGIVYLASEESKFTTGSELVIDGGYTIQ